MGSSSPAQSGQLSACYKDSIPAGVPGTQHKAHAIQIGNNLHWQSVKVKGLPEDHSCFSLPPLSHCPIQGW